MSQSDPNWGTHGDYADPPEERPHKASDSEQIRVAKILFEWWWEVSRRHLFPEGTLAIWEDAIPEAQAYWMEGAWRIRIHADA